MPRIETDEQTMQDYRTAAHRFSDAVYEKVQERVAKATANWLFAYGIPKTPGELLHFATILGSTMPGTLLMDGAVVPAEGAESTEQEREARKEVADQLDAVGARDADPLAVLARAVNGHNTEHDGYYGTYI